MRKLLFFSSVLTFTVMIFGVLTLLVVVANGTIPWDPWQVFLLGNICLVLAWCLSLSTLEKSGMRVIELSKTSLCIAGVARDFIKAVRRDQRGDISWNDDEDDR
jgi:hypothetical protein